MYSNGIRLADCEWINTQYTYNPNQQIEFVGNCYEIRFQYVVRSNVNLDYRAILQDGYEIFPTIPAVNAYNQVVFRQQPECIDTTNYRITLIGDGDCVLQVSRLVPRKLV